MLTFEKIGLDYIDIIVMVVVALCSFLLTKWLYPKYIAFAKKRDWVGHDIHKKDRPEVAESGGIPFLIGIIPPLISAMILFPEITDEVIVFLVTILLSGLIGFIDDRIVLSSLKKIVIMIIIGLPIFILNWFDYIHIKDPFLPILGQLRLTIIYPFVIPLIIAIMTNMVNMLEGYNGEGSGTSLIAVIFLLVCAVISESAQGLIYSIAIIGPLVAFFLFNKYPAKVFPGDVGTLALGAALGCIGVFGSLEVAMFCVVLVHVFNGFYVIASLKGLKERHTITTTDIQMTEDDIIKPSTGKEDHLTLPRLIVAEKPLNEPQLVRNFWALSYIGGLFALVAEVIKLNTRGQIDLIWTAVLVLIITCGSIPILFKFKAIRGIVYFMLALLCIGVIFLFVIDRLVVNNPLNWLITGILAGLGFVYWYYLTIKYFWYKMSKVSGIDYEIKLIPFLRDTVNDILKSFLGRIFGNDDVQAEADSD